MRALERRLRRLEVVTLLQRETEEERRYRERIGDFLRRSAERLGVLISKEPLEPGWRSMSLAEILRSGRNWKES